VKDQELNPRPHTPRPAALPVKVEQWEHEGMDRNPSVSTSSHKCVHSKKWSPLHGWDWTLEQFSSHRRNCLPQTKSPLPAKDFSMFPSLDARITIVVTLPIPALMASPTLSGTEHASSMRTTLSLQWGNDGFSSGQRNPPWQAFPALLYISSSPPLDRKRHRNNDAITFSHKFLGKVAST